MLFIVFRWVFVSVYLYLHVFEIVDPHEMD